VSALTVTALVKFGCDPVPVTVSSTLGFHVSGGGAVPIVNRSMST
jgi:hypothetical protein